MQWFMEHKETPEKINKINYPLTLLWKYTVYVMAGVLIYGAQMEYRHNRDMWKFAGNVVNNKKLRQKTTLGDQGEVIVDGKVTENGDEWIRKAILYLKE